MAGLIRNAASKGEIQQLRSTNSSRGGRNQVNFYRIPTCENFVAPPLAFVDRGQTQAGMGRIVDEYRHDIKKKYRGILCKHCGRFEVRSEEHKSEIKSLMRISYAVLC